MLQPLGLRVVCGRVRSRRHAQRLYGLRQQINGEICVEDHERLTRHCERQFHAGKDGQPVFWAADFQIHLSPSRLLP